MIFPCPDIIFCPSAAGRAMHKELLGLSSVPPTLHSRQRQFWRCATLPLQGRLGFLGKHKKIIMFFNYDASYIKKFFAIKIDSMFDLKN